MNQNRPLRIGHGPRDEPEDAGDEVDLVSLLRTLWRGRYWIVFAGLFGVLAAWYHVTYRVVPVYVANATLALEVQQESLVSFDAVVKGMSGDDATVTTQMAIIGSRRLVTRLVETLGLVDDPEFNPTLPQPQDDGLLAATSDRLTGLTSAARDTLESVGVVESRPSVEFAPLTDQQVLELTVNSVMGTLTVTRQEWSYLITISATTRDPRKSARIANVLAELYIDDQLDAKFEKMRQATGWLSSRVTDLQGEVEESAKTLKDFVAGANLISEDVLQAMNLRLKDQRERLSETIATADGLDARMAAIRAARASGEPLTVAAVAEDPTLDRILPQLLAGEDAATSLFEARYDQLMTRLATDLERARSQQSLLAQSVQRQQAEIERQSDELVRVEQLEREADANRVLYEYFLTRLKETSVQEGIQQPDARIISPAVVPRGPSDSGRNRTLALGLVLGTLLGGGVFMLRERLDDRIRTPGDLEDSFPIPILGQIPRIPGWSRRAVFNYLIRKPASSASEAVRNLRTSLLLSNASAPPQVIAITSALPGEGKTTTAFALAHNYAGLGKKVLLVEGDVRRGTFAELVDRSKAQAGLVEVVAGDAILEEAALRAEGLQFDVLIGGETLLNPADVLSSRDFADFLSEARKLYDIVILDTPPLLVVPDARVISQHADCVLFSVLWNRTTRDQIRDAVQQITSTGIRPTGFVLANIDTRGIRKYGYANRYAAYSRTYAKAYYQD